MKSFASFLSTVAKVGFCALGFGLCSTVSAQNYPFIHLINDSSQNAMTVLNGGAFFTTDFRGSNDVTITALTGTVNSLYTDHYGGSTPGNNPGYLTSFVGTAATGTGDGTAGGFVGLETDFDTSKLSLQYDFAQPLTPVDRIVIADVDRNEQCQIHAYQRVNGVYQPVSLANWTHEAFSGQTGATPDATWAIWDPASGTLTSATHDSDYHLDEPLDVLTPDQPVDRIVFTKLAGNGGSALIQVIETIPALPAVTLTASIPSVTAGSGQYAEFLVTLSAAQTSDVVVNFTIKGSALNGTDYKLLKTAKKIKAGKTSKPIKIIPQGDLGGAGKRTVVLTLQPGIGYTVGTAGKVKVKITD